MARFATLALAPLFLAAFGAPLNEEQHLAKRVTHTGRGTWYEVGLGACGYENVDSDFIIAISHDIYGSGGNCNQYVHITNNANGVSQWAQTRDECMGCGATDIDMSPSLFESLGADLGQGVLNVAWHFENKDFVLP